MPERHPPFTPHPGGRLRQLEYVPAIDASAIAWSGALDGNCDPNSWPWLDWAEREVWLQERRWIREALRLERFVVGVESPTEIRMRAHFVPIRGEVHPNMRAGFGQLLFFESTPC